MNTINFNTGKFEFAGYSFDADRRVLTSESKVNKLTTKEANLLQALVERKNDVLTRDEALLAIWGDNNFFNSRSMDVYVCKLKKLFEGSKVMILNIHGTGYKMMAD